MAPLIRIRTERGEEALDLDEFEQRVRRGEIAAHCPVCFPPVTAEGWARADQLELFRRLHEPRKLYFARAFNLGRFPKVTALFIILDIGLYVMMGARGPIDQDALVEWGAKVAPLMVDLGQLWRLVTANLLHQNALHISFNLFILFNVGGALENAYRPLDYVLLLAASALGTTLVSVWALPEAVTAGASGIVYGALGGAVVFGIKYRDLLPQRYRRSLGESTIPIVLVFLYLGFTSTGVDSWAHLGGLLAGALAALFVKPRLLVHRPASTRSTLLRASPLVLAAAFLGAGSLWLQARPAHLTTRADDALGMAIAVPPLWWRRAERAGALAFSNGLSGVGRASVSARAELMGERDLEQVMSEWIDRQLLGEERAGVLREVVLGGPVPGSLAGREATRIEGSYVENGATTRFRALFLGRGALVYQAVFQWSSEYPRYERLVEQMQARVRLLEPRSLREARARAVVAPGRTTLAVLGEALGELGEERAAAEAFERVVARAASDGDALARLARHRLALGETREGCRRAREAISVAPRSLLAHEAMSGCETAQGDRHAAVAWLRRALETEPEDRRLKRLLDRLLRSK